MRLSRYWIPPTVFLFELSQSLVKANVGSEHLPMLDFALGEQNGPLVQFLLARFGGLAAIFVGFPARFLRFLPGILFPLALLRFEPNFLFAAFVS